VNLQGSDNVQVPDSFKERATLWGNNVWDFESQEDEED
jgi:hypothetical protein